MTKAGEQPTITPEDRKAYAALYLKDQGGPHSVHDLSVAAEIEMGIHDDWDGVQAFAAHRNLHESTPENNLAGGLWYRRWFALANTRTTSLAAQDGLVEALEGLIEQCVACEKELTEVVYQTDYCGESGPLCNARKALSAIKGDKS